MTGSVEVHTRINPCGCTLLEKSIDLIQSNPDERTARDFVIPLIELRCQSDHFRDTEEVEINEESLDSPNR
ncbi:hypothetical protein [Granulicella arctica]|uniref:hypothetical protein n=1 Tax=Granulicella arctica TaxID=940613 RepID=UPI0021DF761E|nr:hypothetical protein [Granulicella arctica]